MTLPSAEHPVITHAEQVRRALLRRDASLLNGLLREYARSYRMLKEDITLFTAAIKDLQPTKGQLLQIAATRNLLDGVQAEMDRFARLLGERISAATLVEFQAANADTLSLVPGMDPAQLVGTWTRLAPEQVYTMFGFTDPNGPLYASIRGKFSQAVAELVRQGLLEGYIMGMNPRAIARILARAQGIGLTWALNTARTANLWSYRAASHANYLSNSHVVRAWTWFAQLDDRVCMSCINQHGSVHSLSEVLADHNRGRCTPIPSTASYAELGIDGVDFEPLVVQRGEDWFRGLPENQQSKMMGPGMFKAWKDGAFEFSQLSQLYNNPIYGRMIRQASLKDILGTRAKLYYGG